MQTLPCKYALKGAQTFHSSRRFNFWFSERTGRAGQRIHSTDGGERGRIPTGDDGEVEQVHIRTRREGHPDGLERSAGEQGREEEGE